MTRLGLSSLVLLILAGCGRSTTESDVKLVGVGYSPDEIGPAPTAYGGTMEYNWLNFAGAGLNLGFAGLLSTEEVGGGSGFKPPYALVYSFGYIFDTKLTGVESISVVPAAPTALDSCYTSYEAQGPMGSFTTVDVGDSVEWVLPDAEESSRMVVDRTPADYPTNPQDLFVYYFGLESWRPEAVISRVPGASDDPLDMEDYILRSSNFPFTEEVEWRFPGALVPFEAPVGSIPLPSTAGPEGSPTISLPARSEGVMMSWTGPRYDYQGELVEGYETGEQKTCLEYTRPVDEAPAAVADCAEATTISSGDTLLGQIYTGPWDSDNGEVAFTWEVPEDASANEQLSLTVRFLAEIDQEADSYQVRMAHDRSALACEEGEWTFDPDLTYRDEFVTQMRGDPQHTLVEVTCRVQDDGEFVLTTDQLADAMSIADAKNAQGSVFFFTRTSTSGAIVPDAKDSYDKRRAISPVLLSARTVEMGRFWY